MARKSKRMRCNTALFLPLARKVNHENQYHQRTTHQTRPRIMQTLSANRPLRQQPRQASRCKGSPGKQDPLRSPVHAADGFLKHRFLPLCEPGSDLPEAALVEDAFFQSLGNVSSHFGFEPLQTERFAYPANIMMALRHASGKIQ